MSQSEYAGDGYEIEVPPMLGFVVHKVVSAPSNGPTIWAWCEIVQGLPGYRSVTFTRADGVTAADPHPDEPGKPLILSSNPLFQLWC